MGWHETSTKNIVLELDSKVSFWERALQGLFSHINGSLLKYGYPMTKSGKRRIVFYSLSGELSGSDHLKRDPSHGGPLIELSMSPWHILDPDNNHYTSRSLEWLKPAFAEIDSPFRVRNQCHGCKEEEIWSVLEKMRQNGDVPASMDDALGIAEVFPELQLLRPLVFLEGENGVPTTEQMESKAPFRAGLYINQFPTLSRIEGRRGLSMCGFGMWQKESLFVAVRPEKV